MDLLLILSYTIVWKQNKSFVGGIVMLVVFLIITFFALFMVILGFVMRSGRASFLIAGYNTSSKKKKKDQYDKKALGKFVGNLMFITAGYFFLIAIAFEFFSTNFIGPIVDVGAVLFILIIIVAIIYMNTSDEFLKKS